MIEVTYMIFFFEVVLEPTWRTFWLISRPELVSGGPKLIGLNIYTYSPATSNYRPLNIVRRFQKMASKNHFPKIFNVCLMCATQKIKIVSDYTSSIIKHPTIRVACSEKQFLINAVDSRRVLNFDVLKKTCGFVSQFEKFFIFFFQLKI